MGTPHPPVASSEVQKRFGYYSDEAMAHPLEIERHGAVRLVLMRADIYKEMALRDHVAVAAEVMSNDDFRALSNARFSKEADELNTLVDEATTS